MKQLTGYRRLFARMPQPAAAWTRLLFIAVVVGVASGLAAAGLDFGLHYGSKYLAGSIVDVSAANLLTFHWELLLLPALGGLLSGLLLHAFCPTAVGHGTDVLVRAFHHDGGRLGLKAPAVKAVAAVGVIACGGSAGPEGPIAALGAAIGSTLARAFSLTPRERRTMLIAGCGAGVGAIFQCPMGGALFAAGILYRDPDYETDAFVPTFVASVIGYTVYISVWGKHFPLLGGATGFAFEHAYELIPYTVLGVVCGAFCIVFYGCLHFVEHRPLARVRMPRWLAPAAGGLATGAVACVLPQVMDGQYAFIRHALTPDFYERFATLGAWHLVTLFAAVALAKCVATALTVGSGASGGVLGPSVFIGGAAGAMVGALVDVVAPGVFSDNLRASLIAVGMAGVLSAAMRAPLAAIVMIAEMTGGYGLIVPSMLVCVSSYIIGRRWGLNREQVRTSADSPAHAGDAIVHMLENWHVCDLMQRAWTETVAPHTTLREMVAMVTPGTRPVFAVLDQGRIVGLVSLPDIRRIMDEPGAGEVIIAADIMTEDMVTAGPDDEAYVALTRMAANNHIVMPVVAPGSAGAFLGMLTRGDVYDAVRRQIEEMRQHLLVEHEGLAAIEHEESLHQLVMGVAPPKTDNIQRLLVPMQSVGRSLRESDFRRTFGVQIIAIEQPDGAIQCPPDPDAPLRTDQRLVAIVFGDAAESPSSPGGS